MGIGCRSITGGRLSRRALFALLGAVVHAAPSRKPREVAEQLAKVYGHELNEVVYIPVFALIGQLRLGNVAEVERLVAPFLNSRDSLAKATGSHLAGHLIFGELAERTGNPKNIERLRAAADLGFTPAGEMREAMPLHNEMSDAVFMGCPLLAKAGKLTREPRYFDMALRHLQFMQKLCLRSDGLYRHSPLADVAWGRGNAFPALGLALTLSDLPKGHPAFSAMLPAFRAHIASLAKYQDTSGMWRQIIDEREAYLEYSATAMIAAAMQRGIRMRWLDRGDYKPRVARAWEAISLRTSPDGVLEGVCESTGKLGTREAYLQRKAIHDRDPRGGAMALFFATELSE